MYVGDSIVVLRGVVWIQPCIEENFTINFDAVADTIPKKFFWNYISRYSSVDVVGAVDCFFRNCVVLRNAVPGDCFKVLINKFLMNNFVARAASLRYCVQLLAKKNRET